MRIEIATFSIDIARNKESTEIRDINRTSSRRWEGTVLRMKEMTNQCTTATGSGRLHFVCEIAL